MYKEKRIFRSEFVPIRGLSYHVQIWEGPGSQSTNLPALVLVHGWMDVAASYPFMVDALSDAFAQGRRVIAPDWRGFGKTNGSADCYWMPDYLADLDFLLDHYTQEKTIEQLKSVSDICTAVINNSKIHAPLISPVSLQSGSGEHGPDSHPDDSHTHTGPPFLPSILCSERSAVCVPCCLPCSVCSVCGCDNNQLVSFLRKCRL